MKIYWLLIVGLLVVSANAQAGQVQATIYRLGLDGPKENIGTISFKDMPDGLLVQRDFMGLPAGPHGIHVHENGDCGSIIVDGKTILGGAAGGHYDPHQTGKHLGPNTDGHKGDLPVLAVDDAGRVTDDFYLKDVNSFDFKGRSVIIHAGGDNYSDTPKPLGGGGDRIACGVIE